MAWPVTARFTAFVANTTRIAAAFLNEIQDVIIAIVAGTKTHKAMGVDGTGYQTTPTSIGGQQARLYVGGAVSNPVLIMEYNDAGAGTAQRRMYAESGGALSLVYNAYWDTGAAKWTQDDGTKDSTRVFLTGSFENAGLVVYGKSAGAAPWTAWNHANVTCGPMNIAAPTADYGVSASEQTRYVYSNAAALSSLDHPLVIEYTGTNQTTDAATLKTLITYAVPSNRLVCLKTTIIGVKNDWTLGYRSVFLDAYRKAGAGAPTNTAAGTTVIAADGGAEITPFQAPGWAVSGNNLLLQLKGVAATTINWMAKVEIVTTG